MMPARAPLGERKRSRRVRRASVMPQAFREYQLLEDEETLAVVSRQQPPAPMPCEKPLLNDEEVSTAVVPSPLVERKRSRRVRRASIMPRTLAGFESEDKENAPVTRRSNEKAPAKQAKQPPAWHADERTAVLQTTKQLSRAIAGLSYSNQAAKPDPPASVKMTHLTSSTFADTGNSLPRELRALQSVLKDGEHWLEANRSRASGSLSKSRKSSGKTTAQRNDYKSAELQPELQPELQQVEITPEELDDMLRELFPQRFGKPRARRLRRRVDQTKQKKPACILPRLIACFAIHRQCTSNGPTMDTKSMESWLPVWDLLERLVDLECTVLEGHDYRAEEGETSIFGANKKRRKVQLSAFDESAVVYIGSDFWENSYLPRSRCVRALGAVLDAVEAVVPQDTALPKKSSSTRMLGEFVAYLDSHLIRHGHDVVCQNSLAEESHPCDSISIERIQSAAKSYSKDLNALIQTQNSTKDSACHRAPLSWEYRLANTSAQLVRYWMRTLMNPIPENVDAEGTSEEWWTRLCDSVRVLEVSEDEAFGDDDESVESLEEANLSFLLSNALIYVYHYLDLGSPSLAGGQDLRLCSWTTRLLESMPDESCCATPICLRGLGSKRHPVTLDADDWQSLRDQLLAASDFCAFHRRAVFLEALLSIVSTKRWIRRWRDTVQETARNLVRLDTARSAIQVEDAHLVLLGMPVHDLLHRLRTQILPLSTERYKLCAAHLRQTTKNFRLGLSNTKRKKDFQPAIGELERYWEDCLQPTTEFPSLAPI